jgi:hypothetical protein
MMMYKILLNKWTIIGLLAMAVLFLFNRNRVLIDQVKTSEHNYQVMLKDSESVVLTTKKQMSQAIEADELAIRLLRDSLKLKDKQISKLVKGGASTIINVRTVLRDSVIYNVIDSVSDVKGVIKKDSIQLNIKSFDSLFVVTSNYKNRKFFVARWFEKPKTKVQITNANHNSTYHINRVFEKSN